MSAGALLTLALTTLAGGARAAAPPPLLGHPVRYVIVTTQGLAPSFAPLVDWKTRKGMPAAVKTLEAIRSEYPAGADDADRVRRFLRDAWSAGARAALIGGDTDVIPIRYARTTFYSGDPLPTDLYYACLDGTWNGDGDAFWGEAEDAADLTPELAVGRAPVRTPAEVARVIARSVQYERFPAGDYEQQRLFAAAVLFPQNWTPGTETFFDGAEMLEPLLPMHAAHGQTVTRLYQNHLDPRWLPGAQLETRGAVRNALDAGTGFATLVGYGHVDRLWTGDSFLDIGDALALQNASRPFAAWLSSSFACAPDSESIGEALLRAPLGGAVGAIGGAHYGFPVAERNYLEAFQRAVHDSGETRVGHALNRARAPYVPFSAFDGVHRWEQMTLTLLGDPDLAIWTRRPLALAVSHAATLAPGQELVVDVTSGSNPVAGATVTLYQPGAMLAILATDAAGRARVTPAGAVDGPLALTVTANGFHAGESTILFGAITAAAVSLVASRVTRERVTIDWYAPDADAAVATLERRDAEGGAWSGRGRVESSGRGLFTGVDESVRAGSRYLYRLAIAADGEVSRSAEVAIEIPMSEVARLALESVAPHPVVAGARLTLVLAGLESARLEAFDLAGRACWSRSVAALGSGRQVVTLEGLERLRPGLYLLRVSQGVASASRRIVVR